MGERKYVADFFYQYHVPNGTKSIRKYLPKTLEVNKENQKKIENV